MSTEAERAVIGGILSSPAVLRDVQIECIPSDFHDQRIGLIYSGICRMAADREPIDVLTVSGHFVEWGVRGIEWQDLRDWQDATPLGSAAGFYAQQVRRASMSRGLRTISARMAEAVDQMGPEEVIARASTELRDLREKHVVDDTAAMSLHEVLHQDVEYDWVIDSLLERKDRLMITGAEGGGKSTLIRQLAITGAAGIHPFREYAIDPVKVLVVDAENTETQWGRETRRWARSIEVLDGARSPYENLHLKCMRRLDLTKDSDLGLVHKLVDEYDPAILFIGPLYRLARKLNNDEDAEPLLAALDTLRDRGLALVIEAHAGHQTNPKGERDLRPRGSSQLLGWPEFGYGLRVSRRNAMHVDMVRWRGDRDQRAWPDKLGRSNVEGAQRWPWRPVDA